MPGPFYSELNSISQALSEKSSASIDILIQYSTSGSCYGLVTSGDIFEIELEDFDGWRVDHVPRISE